MLVQIIADAGRYTVNSERIEKAEENGCYNPRAVRRLWQDLLRRIKENLGS